MKRWLVYLITLCSIGCSDTLYQDEPEKEQRPHDGNDVRDAGTPAAGGTVLAQSEPTQDQPLLNDSIPPEIEIRFAGEHEKAKMLTFLDGDVFFNVVAKDSSGVSQVKAIAPPIEKSERDNIFGPIKASHVQSSVSIAKECGAESKFKADLKEKSIEPKNVVCACFEASDAAGNSQRELACFQRQLPTSVIDAPAHGSRITARKFYEGTLVKATISSGVELAECSWAIYPRENNAPERIFFPKGDGRLSGSGCIINEMVSAQLPQGKYYLVVYAKDIAGRTLHDGPDVAGKNFVNFRVSK